MSQVERHLISISPSFPRSTVSMKQETTPKKEMEQSKMFTDFDFFFFLKLEMMYDIFNLLKN